MNKNISIWRGSDAPPTNYHIWVKSDNSINLFVEDKWKTITDPKAYEHLVQYVDEQINLLKSGVDIDFDTLKEISDWIKEHLSDYTSILPKIQTELETLTSSVQDINTNGITKSNYAGVLDTRYYTEQEINNILKQYLPLTGGWLSGNLNLNNNNLINTIIHSVEEFPTNAVESQVVTYNGRIYTYFKGKWLSVADDIGDLEVTYSGEFFIRPTADSTLSIKNNYAKIHRIYGNTIVLEDLLVSFNGDIIKSVRFNQINNLIDNVFINEFGVEVLNSVYRTSEYIRVIPNITYYFTNILNGTINPSIYEYSLDKTYLQYKILTDPGNFNDSINVQYTIPDNVHYIRLSKLIRDNTQICLSLHTGEVEPYKESTLSLLFINSIKDNEGNLLFPEGLKSAGDAYDEIVWDEELGKYKAIKRIGSVDLGTLYWLRTLMVDRYAFNAQIQGILPATKSTYTSNILQSKYTFDRTSGTTTQENKTIRRLDISIFIRDDVYTDVDAFKESISDVTLYYELATPVEIILDELYLFYEAWDRGTEELVSTNLTSALKADIQYNFNAVDMLRDHQRNILLIKQDLLKIDNKIQTAITSAITQTLNTNI